MSNIIDLATYKYSIVLDDKNFSGGMNNAGDSVNNLQGKFSGLANFLKVSFIGGLAAAGAVAIKLGKDVVKQFGELEQNLGGSEAVFGKYAESIQKMGEDAYKNLGVSQSDYLATANKMGALFQGSGVEQQKSLELTENAMQRAADMASVMGIDMQVALDSVAGAAKGNFTMMDNLGVAMNATNIEAYALAKGLDFTWNTATQAEKAELAMQMFFENTEQYAGNFAKESTQTISGSIGLMQAALGSFTAGLGNANADMTNLTKNMVDAFQSVVKNIVPVIKNIVTALPPAMDAVLSAIGDLLPMLLETATGLFTQVLQTIIQLLPELIPAAVSAILTIVGALIDNLPLIVGAAAQLIIALVDGLGTALPTLIPAMVEAIVLIAQTLLDNMDQLLAAAFTLMEGLATGLIDALPELIKELPKIITSIVDFIVNNLPEIINLGITLIVQLAAGLIQAIPQLLASLPQIINALINGISSYIESFKQAGKNILTGLWQGIVVIWSSITNWIDEKINGMISWFGGLYQSFVNIGQTIFNGLFDGLKNTWSSITSFINDSISWLADKLTFWNNSKSEMSSGVGNAVSIPSYSVGTPFVPNTGLALLHRGESVIPAHLNQYNPANKGQSSSNGGNNYTVNIAKVETNDAASFIDLLPSIFHQFKYA